MRFTTICVIKQDSQCCQKDVTNVMRIPDSSTYYVESGIGERSTTDGWSQFNGISAIAPLKKVQKRYSRTRSCRSISQHLGGVRTRGETLASARACRALPKIEPATYI